MRKSAIVFFACSLASVGLGAHATAQNTETFFDKPLRVAHVMLPRDPDNPQAKTEVRCSYYSHFMVKEIDLGEPGADQLSILPVKGNAPACQRKNAAGEKVVSADDWTGYLKGAVGDYIFFDAEDGWNGGLGFAVFTPGAKKLFDDVAKSWHSIGTVPVSASAGAPEQGLALRYVRVYGAKCSLGDVRAEACWKMIEKDTGIDAPMPDCKRLYVREQRRTPKFAKEVPDDPAVVEYVVVTALAMNGTHVTALRGGAPTCAPQE